MFDNIGRKLKTLAKVFCWIGIIGSLIGAIPIWVSGSQASRYRYSSSSTLSIAFIGLLVLVFGCLLSWIASWALYAFGEMVEDTDAIRNSLESRGRRPSYLNTNEQKSIQEEKKDCPYCGARNSMENTTCYACGKSI